MSQTSMVFANTFMVLLYNIIFHLILQTIPKYLLSLLFQNNIRFT